MFVPGRLVQPGLIIVGKANALPEWSTRKVLQSIRLQPYLRILDKAIKACQEKTLWLIRPFVSYEEDKLLQIQLQLIAQEHKLQAYKVL